jgi:hypothetical protein
MSSSERWHDAVISSGDVFNLALEKNLLDSPMGDGGERSQQSRFGHTSKEGTGLFLREGQSEQGLNSSRVEREASKILHFCFDFLATGDHTHRW